MSRGYKYQSSAEIEAQIQVLLEKKKTQEKKDAKEVA